MVEKTAIFKYAGIIGNNPFLYINLWQYKHLFYFNSCSFFCNIQSETTFQTNQVTADFWVHIIVNCQVAIGVVQSFSAVLKIDSKKGISQQIVFKKLKCSVVKCTFVSLSFRERRERQQQQQQQPQYGRSAQSSSEKQLRAAQAGLVSLLMCSNFICIFSRFRISSNTTWFDWNFIFCHWLWWVLLSGQECSYVWPFTNIYNLSTFSKEPW